MPQDNDDRDLQIALARLTLGMTQIQQDIAEMKQRQAQFATMSELQRLDNQIRELRTALEEKYVTVSRFQPVEKAVYALLTFIAITVLGAMLAQVIITP